MTVSLSRKIKLAFAMLTGAVLLATPPALAQRVSLGSIDAKLDQILAGQGGGFNVDNHVQLQLGFFAGGCFQDLAYSRVSPSGVASNTSFVVPAGKVLIITDVQWNSLDAPVIGFNAGRVLRFRLTSRFPNGSQPQQVFVSAPVEVTAANNLALLGDSETLRAGIAVGAGREICPITSNSSQSSTTFNTPGDSWLRGVLVPE